MRLVYHRCARDWLARRASPRQRRRSLPTPSWSTARSSPSMIASRIAEALAIRGRRIVAVGSTAEIEKLKGPQTRTIDLNRPHRDPRPDRQSCPLGARRRARRAALRRRHLAPARAAAADRAGRAQPSPANGSRCLAAGRRSSSPTSRAASRCDELDRIAPNNPVVLQAVYNHSYLNSVGACGGQDRRQHAQPARRHDREGRQRQADRPRARRRRRRLRGGQGFRMTTRRPGSPIPASSWPISIRWG